MGYNGYAIPASTIIKLHGKLKLFFFLPFWL